MHGEPFPECMSKVLSQNWVALVSCLCKFRTPAINNQPTNMKSFNYSKSVTPFAATLCLMFTGSVGAQTAAELSQRSRRALNLLCANNSAAAKLRSSAVGILVFPKIVKAGFIVGAQHGEGALLSHGRAIGYYRTTAASYGLQAGIQKFGYAMFFMNQGDLNYLRQSNGWEFGSGPSVVIVDQGMARTFSTTSMRKGVYVFTFDQRGLMAGLGLQGSKITPFRPD
jgi:lipid-binding SYLF domain-containing protein